MNMKFIKGMVMGGLLSAGVVMMYNDKMGSKRNKMMRKGKQLIKKMGII